jgi:hypothetical protein
MREKQILFILIQIDEAHSTKWKTGLENHPDPHKNIQDRLGRANNFINDSNVTDPFFVYVDNWSNDFAEMYQAWPDKYYHFDSDLKVLTKSEYGTGTDNHPDALIKFDCLDLIRNLLSQ